MILDAILIFFLGFAYQVMQTIPPVFDFDINVTAIREVDALWAKVSCVVPVDTMLTALVIWLILTQTEFLVACLNWVLRKIPGVS